MRIAIVSGAIANKYAKGGEAWVRLSYARGLRRLGFDVYLVEQIAPNACIDAAGAPTSFERSANLEYFRCVAEQFGMAGRAALVDEVSRTSDGIDFRDLQEIAGAADLLVNVTGHLCLSELKSRIRCKIYVDIDPGFTQFWHAAGDPGPHLEGHDWYFTIGENIGTPNCFIPADGVPWHTTRPPVVLEDWPVVAPLEFHGFTTVASWRGAYGPVEFGGRTFGLKVHEFRRFWELPARTRERFEVALDIHPADGKDLGALRSHGWRIADPRTVAGEPRAFQEYIRQSGAEFSVAQRIYVETHSGWFSDRTVRYLASGKPALIQDTGFSRNYPVGAGLVTFHTPEEALAGVRSIRDDYGAHCHAARALAEQHFDSDRVLGRLLEEAGLSP